MDLMVWIGAWALTLLLAGFYLPLSKSIRLARIVAWTMVIMTTVFAIEISAAQAPLLRMFMIVSFQLLAMKIPVMVEVYRGKRALRPLNWLAFALGWFGMRPQLFEHLFSKALGEIRPLALSGFSRIALGFALLWCSKWLDNHHVGSSYVSDLLMLPGLSLILHFGLLNLSAAFWRLFGVNVKSLFIAPYKSKSLQEFWGKRWNLAFSEMTAIIAYKPLKSVLGTRFAMLGSFLLSGLLHEIAISFPVNSGYGLPLLYFVFHGMAMYAESAWSPIRKIIHHRYWSHVWVMGCLVLPMPLLFHAAFLQEVLRPLRNLLI